MKAAIVREAGKTPIYGDFKEPVPANGEVEVAVSAAALSNVVKSRASGKHYSSSGQLPFVVGIDGVGRLNDGRRVYFVLPKAPFGSMSEKTIVRSSQCVPLPDDRMGCIERTGEAHGGGNGAGQRSNRHGGPSGRADRQIYGRRKGCGHGQKCGSPESTFCPGR